MAKVEQKINPNTVNMVANTTEFNGDLVTDSDIKFDGKLEGKLITKNKLVLGKEGKIKGEVRCKSAVISGQIEGKIFVEEIIKLEASAQIDGELTTSKLAIEPGAIFNGTCIMTKKAENILNTKKEEN
jgi:cytoskeletal protein CcmA (bactofilin family)